MPYDEIVSSLLTDYSFDSPDYVWENITPRQAGFLLGYAAKRQARRALRLLGIFHSEKPADLQAALKEAAFGSPAMKDPEMANVESALRMARLMGSDEAVARVEKIRRKLPRVRAAMAYMEKKAREN